MASSAELARLQHLALVSKVSQELDNHLGVADRTLAEFVIELAGGCGDAKAFHGALAENGAELGAQLCETLFAQIAALKKGSRAAGAGASSGAAKDAAAGGHAPRGDDPSSRRFPGLAVPDTRAEARELGEELCVAPSDESGRTTAARISMMPTHFWGFSPTACGLRLEH